MVKSETLSVGTGPTGVAIHPGGSLALVTSINDATVSVIDLTGESPVVESQTLSVGTGPTGVANSSGWLIGPGD